MFRDKLSEAVKLRLMADVPVGCYLSGGLDSATAVDSRYSPQFDNVVFMTNLR